MALLHVSHPHPLLRLVGVRTSHIYIHIRTYIYIYIYIFLNISWTLSSGPHYKSLFGNPTHWLHPVTEGVYLE